MVFVGTDKTSHKQAHQRTTSIAYPVKGSSANQPVRGGRWLECRISFAERSVVPVAYLPCSNTSQVTSCQKEGNGNCARPKKLFLTLACDIWHWHLAFGINIVANAIVRTKELFVSHWHLAFGINIVNIKNEKPSTLRSNCFNSNSTSTSNPNPNSNSNSNLQNEKTQNFQRNVHSYTTAVAERPPAPPLLQGGLILFRGGISWSPAGAATATTTVTVATIPAMPSPSTVGRVSVTRISPVSARIRARTANSCSKRK